MREYAWDLPAAGGDRWQWIKGRDFFSEVAPWSPVRHFRAQHRLMVDAGRDEEADLAFLSRTAASERVVLISIHHLPREGATTVRIEQLPENGA